MLFSSTLDLVIIGRSILSSFGNPQAELYRGLVGELAQHGHRTVFLERQGIDQEKPRDMLRTPYCEVWTYEDVESLKNDYREAVKSADIVMLGSNVAHSSEISDWIANEANGVKVYYDTDLGKTLRSLNNDNDDLECVSCRTLPGFDLFLSTTGGPVLEQLGTEYKIRCVRPLYESIDPYYYYRTDAIKEYELGFIGQNKPGRMKKLDGLLLEPARLTPNRRFALVGNGYELDATDQPDNLTFVEHLPDTNLVDFYNRMQCSLVVSRDDRSEMGYTPSKRLLVAAACGVPILTDHWTGLDQFLEADRECYVVDNCQEVLDVLYHLDPKVRMRVGAAARERVLAEHTTARRAQQLLQYWEEVAD
ncbi:MAG: glycosyltransferase [Bacteroidota bacterium]